jgi:hypothetical protein
MYKDEDDELVETLEKCLMGKISNAKMKTIISLLVSIVNDSVDEITFLREEKSQARTLLEMGYLLFIWLREYRYYITHSNWKNIASFYSIWKEDGGFENKHSKPAEFAIKMILKLHPELGAHKKKRRAQYNRFFSILRHFNKRCELAHLAIQKVRNKSLSKLLHSTWI